MFQTKLLYLYTVYHVITPDKIEGCLRTLRDMFSGNLDQLLRSHGELLLRPCDLGDRLSGLSAG